MSYSHRFPHLEQASEIMLCGLSRHPLQACVLGCIVSCLSGCGSTGQDPVYPATGIVRLEGSPVENAVVAFIPEGSGTPSVAMTDGEGRFSLTSPPGRKGLPAGSYRVSIRKSSSADLPSEPVTFEDMEREHQQGLKAKPIEFKVGVPPRYGDPQTSQLHAEVTPTGENEFVFELKG